MAAPLIFMLKIASVIGPANKNLKQDGQEVQMENQDEKELV